MKKLVYTPEAVRQLKSIRIYISETLNNPKAANDVLGRITAGCRSLVDFPNLGRQVNLIDDGTPVRLLIVEKYIIVYDVTEDSIRVVSVEDARSDWASSITRH